MLKALLIWVIPGLVEIIHVELSNKWGEIIMLKISGENPLSKFIWLPNYKAVSWFTPPDDGVQGRVLKPHCLKYAHYSLNIKGRPKNFLKSESALLSSLTLTMSKVLIRKEGTPTNAFWISSSSCSNTNFYLGRVCISTLAISRF